MMLEAPIETSHVVDAMLAADKYPMAMQVAAALFKAGAGEGFATMCAKVHASKVVPMPVVIAVENYLRDFKKGNREIDAGLERLITR